MTPEDRHGRRRGFGHAPRPPPSSLHVHIGAQHEIARNQSELSRLKVATIAKRTPSQDQAPKTPIRVKLTHQPYGYPRARAVHPDSTQRVDRTFEQNISPDCDGSAGERSKPRPQTVFQQHKTKNALAKIRALFKQPRARIRRGQIQSACFRCRRKKAKVHTVRWRALAPDAVSSELKAELDKAEELLKLLKSGTEYDARRILQYVRDGSGSVEDVARRIGETSVLLAAPLRDACVTQPGDTSPQVILPDGVLLHSHMRAGHIATAVRASWLVLVAHPKKILTAVRLLYMYRNGRSNLDKASMRGTIYDARHTKPEERLAPLTNLTGASAPYVRSRSREPIDDTVASDVTELGNPNPSKGVPKYTAQRWYPPSTCARTLFLIFALHPTDRVDNRSIVRLKLSPSLFDASAFEPARG
ncbi:hypothetical protein KC353_g22 [Hortaea werneckii]|nr:hypothetical protein KC353_g22 [Hortaea werneckii]